MKRIGILFLTLTLLLFSFNISVFAEDSEPSAWAVKEVNELMERKILDESLFVDYQSFINREDFAYLSVRVYEVLTGKVAEMGDNPFVDTNDAWVLKGYDLGILKGYGNGLYGPDDLITREQLATLLIRMLNAAEVMIDDEVAGIEFADNGEISEWAKEFVYIAFKNQIVTGVGENRMAPKMNATREQSMLMANRIIDKFEEGTVNLGAASVQGDWIYHFKLRESSFDAFSDLSEIVSGLYKTKLDNSESKLISDDIGTFMIVEGDWIYYSPVMPDDTKAIYKTKTDGSERIKLSDDSFFSPMIGKTALLDGEWLYYLNVDDESRLYRVKTDGSVRESITEVSVLTFNIKDEWIYFTSYNIHHIVKMKKDGTESSLILEDDTATFVMLQDISDDHIYFTNDSKNSLKKFDLNSSDINDIYIDGIRQIEVKEDRIYYVTYTDTQELISEIYSAKTDGSGIERLTNNNAFAMKVIDDWIYYLSMDIASGSTKLNRVKTDGSSQETFKAEGIFAGFLW